MNSQERVAAVLAGRVPDRVPRDTGCWQTTTERWRREGLPEGVSPAEYFGTDEIARLSGDFSMRFPERVVEEGENTRTYWDHEGALKKDLRTDEGWTSQWLDYTIKGRDDWLEHRDRLKFDESRIPGSLMESWQRARAAGKAIFYQSHACFHPTWGRIGMVNEMVLMMEDPDFIHELFAAQTQLVIDIFEGMVKQGATFDAAFLADDLGYVVSPLISPAMYRELVFPYHKQLCDHFAGRGLKTILHSDGNVGPLIPHFLDAGFSGLNPLEAKAGLDVRKLRPEYGDRLVLHGNIDVRKLAGTREDIEEEIAGKFPAAMAGGGYIFGSDHSVPNNVSFENFCFAMELVERYGKYLRVPGGGR